jgi:hypothetical protein
MNQITNVSVSPFNTPNSLGRRRFAFTVPSTGSSISELEYSTLPARYAVLTGKYKVVQI